MHETRTFSEIVSLPVRIWKIWDSERQLNAFKKTERRSVSEKRSEANARSSENYFTHKKHLKELRIACVADTFTYSFFSQEADLYYLSADNWLEAIREKQPDMLLVESAWKGHDGSWVDEVEKQGQTLEALLRYCRQEHIPTVFWNKEDPVYFNTFIETALAFDFVFTTDLNSVMRYRKILGEARAFVLPFGVQPHIHNPVQKYDRKHAVVFAGSYYHRHKHRNKVLASFMTRLIPEIPVEIYDREYKNPSSSHQFPSAYAPYIKGTLPYDRIDVAYKGYRFAINLNSVTASPTMCSRRVFELVASNTTVLSNPSECIRNFFGDLLTATDDGDIIVSVIRLETENPLLADKKRVLALRKVMQEHTAADRLAFVASCIFGKTFEKPQPKVLVLGYAENEEEKKRIKQAFGRQTYPNAELVLIGEDVACEEALFADADYAACMVASDHYGANYLLDLVTAFEYGEYDAVGKVAHYELTDSKSVVFRFAERVFRETTHLPIRSSMIRLKSLSETGQTLCGLLDAYCTAVFTVASGLGIDPFNYGKNFADAEQWCAIVDDLEGIETGYSLEEVIGGG